MRKRRGNSSRVRVTAKGLANKDNIKIVKKLYEHPVLRVCYKDAQDIVTDVVIPFGNQYLEDCPYKENFEDIASHISEDGGILWINDNVIVPARRVLGFHMIEESAPQKEKPLEIKPKPRKTKEIK